MSSDKRSPAGLFRPEPRRGREARPVDRGRPPRFWVRLLLEGQTLRVADRFETAEELTSELYHQLPSPGPGAPRPAREAWRRRFSEAAQGLLVPVRGGHIALDGAPSLGFLEELYPELSDFLLPYEELHRMHNAWVVYERGVHLAVLGARLHPFYGTYLPSRVEHLELFATWLAGYQGPRRRAVDVGTGCGVLAFQLCRAGFEQVLATDLNPNAVESVRRELDRLDAPAPMAVRRADLLEPVTRPVDVVVFNPPWVPGQVEGLLDWALVYEEGLFERFFEQAHARLQPGGRVVLVFSDLIRLVRPDAPHPIEIELRRGRFELVQKLRRKVKPTVSRGGGPSRRTRERVEIWELAPVATPRSG